MSDIQKYCVEVLGLGLTQIRRRLIRKSQVDMCAIGILVMKKTQKYLKIGREGLCRCMHGSCFMRRPVKVIVGSKKNMYCCINSLL